VKFSKGFNLIEVIMILIVLAIASTMVISYIGTSFTQSAVPAGLVSRQYALIQQMEIFTSQYRDQLQNNTAFSLSTFKTNYIDGKPYVYAANTGLITLSSGNYVTGNVLLVTLTNSTANYTQSLQSIFTQ
jgi:Tfp pilus assembly protein PilE